MNGASITMRDLNVCSSPVFPQEVPSLPEPEIGLHDQVKTFSNGINQVYALDQGNFATCVTLPSLVTRELSVVIFPLI